MGQFYAAELTRILRSEVSTISTNIRLPSGLEHFAMSLSDAFAPAAKPALCTRFRSHLILA